MVTSSIKIGIRSAEDLDNVHDDSCDSLTEGAGLIAFRVADTAFTRKE